MHQDKNETVAHGHTEKHSHDSLWTAAKAAAKGLFRRPLEFIPGEVQHVTLSQMRESPSPDSTWGKGATEHGEFVFYPSGLGTPTLAPVCWEEFMFSEFQSLRDSDGLVYTAVVRDNGRSVIRVVTMDQQSD